MKKLLKNMIKGARVGKEQLTDEIEGRWDSDRNNSVSIKKGVRQKTEVFSVNGSPDTRVYRSGYVLTIRSYADLFSRQDALDLKASDWRSRGVDIVCDLFKENPLDLYKIRINSGELVIKKSFSTKSWVGLNANILKTLEKHRY